MPVLKPITGHTSCKGPFFYLTKSGRALDSDYLNMDVPDRTAPGNVFPWYKEMDATRHRYHHDIVRNGKPPRMYKHYIVSPNPEDALSLAGLKDLATAWAEKHFEDYQCAIVYHDDNESHIPHAHVIVNCTNLHTGRKLQDPDPSALNRSLQRLADDRLLRHFKNMEGDAPITVQGRHAQRAEQPKSMQVEYTRRSEVQLKEQGKYSWVADIRARVKVARSVAHSEAEFRSLLDELGVQVRNNSTKAARADWIYSLADAPSRRVSGEKLGLAYGRESLLRRFDDSLKSMLPKAYEERLADIVKQAVAIDDLAQLQRLSDAVTLIERDQIKSSVALDVFMRRPYERKAWNDLTQEEAASASKFIHQEKMLPFRTPGKPSRTPITSEEAYAATRPQRKSAERPEESREQRSYARETPVKQQTRNNQER